MNNSTFISPIVVFFVLLIIAGIFLLSYSNNFQRRLSRIIDLPPRRQRNILLAIAAMCFLLINPIMHAILLGAGVLLYRYFIKEDGTVLTNPKRKLLYQTSIICIPKEEVSNEAESLTSLRKCLFASSYIVPASEANILVERGEYKVNVTLFSEKYLNSLIHYLGESGFTAISNAQK